MGLYTMKARSNQESPPNALSALVCWCMDWPGRRRRNYWASTSCPSLVLCYSGPDPTGALTRQKSVVCLSGTVARTNPLPMATAQQTLV